jgi:hypothetical protein
MKRVLAALAALMATATAALAATPAPNVVTFVRGNSAGAVWVAAGNGGHARKLGAGYEPLVSPDGAEVAAARDADSGPALTLYPTAGSGAPQSLLNIAQGYVEPLAWSPDSRYLAVAVQDNAVKGLGHAGLIVIDTRTMTTTTVAHGIVSGASFAPGTSDELVYGLSTSQSYDAKINLFSSGPTGSGRVQLTTNGTSLNPVWGAKGIIFDRETARGADSAPQYELWLLAGGHARQLTHMRVGTLVEGLAPLAVSASGNRLIAEFVGQDTSYAYAVQISPLKVRQVSVPHQYPQGAGISPDGSTLLLDAGAFENSPAHGEVETVPFGGGRATRLVAGASPSWDG